MPVISGSYGECVNGRQEHWPVWFERTDAGRALSKRPHSKNDCTVRALALVCGLGFDRVYDILADAGRKSHRGFHCRSFLAAVSGTPIINGIRFEWIPFQAVKGQTRMNPAKFAVAYPHGRYIAKTAGHVFAVIDGVCYDTHSPSPARCIYGAWRVTIDSGITN